MKKQIRMVVDVEVENSMSDEEIVDRVKEEIQVKILEIFYLIPVIVGKPEVEILTYEKQNRRT